MSLKTHLYLLAALFFFSIPAFAACAPAAEDNENPTAAAQSNVEATASLTAVPTAQPTTTPAPTATASPTPLEQAYVEAGQIVADKGLEPTDALVQLAAALFVVPAANEGGIPLTSPENATLHEENGLTYALLADGSLAELRQVSEIPQVPDDLRADILVIRPAVDENGNPLETIQRGMVTVGGEQVETWTAYDIATGELSRYVDPAHPHWATPLFTDANGNIQAVQTQAIDENGNATGEVAYRMFNDNGEMVDVPSPNTAFDSLDSYLREFSQERLVYVMHEGVETIGIEQTLQEKVTHVYTDTGNGFDWLAVEISTISIDVEEELSHLSSITSPMHPNVEVPSSADSIGVQINISEQLLKNFGDFVTLFVNPNDPENPGAAFGEQVKAVLDELHPSSANEGIYPIPLVDNQGELYIKPVSITNFNVQIVTAEETSIPTPLNFAGNFDFGLYETTIPGEIVVVIKQPSHADDPSDNLIKNGSGHSTFIFNLHSLLFYLTPAHIDMETGTLIPKGEMNATGGLLIPLRSGLSWVIAGSFPKSTIDEYWNLVLFGNTTLGDIYDQQK